MDRILWIDPCNKGRYKAIVHFENAKGQRHMKYMDAKDLEIFLDINEFP